MQVEKLFASGDGLRDWSASLNGNALHELEVSSLMETLFTRRETFPTHKSSPRVRKAGLSTPEQRNRTSHAKSLVSTLSLH